MRRALPIAVAVPIIAAGLLLAGCSEMTTGSPTSGSATSGSAAGGTSTPTSAGAPSATADDPAKRPKTIDIEGVDPCTLLTDAQRAELGLDRPPLKGTSTVQQSPDCTFSREARDYIASVTTATKAGIEFYTDGRFDVEATKLEVGGFPAVLGSTPEQTTSCWLGVDVSDGQMLHLQATSPDGRVDQPGLCRIVTQVAGAAVATLMAR